MLRPYLPYLEAFIYAHPVASLVLGFSLVMSVFCHEDGGGFVDTLLFFLVGSTILFNLAYWLFW